MMTVHLRRNDLLHRYFVLRDLVGFSLSPYVGQGWRTVGIFYFNVNILIYFNRNAATCIDDDTIKAQPTATAKLYTRNVLKGFYGCSRCFFSHFKSFYTTGFTLFFYLYPIQNFRYNLGLNLINKF